MPPKTTDLPASPSLLHRLGKPRVWRIAALSLAVLAALYVAFIYEVPVRVVNVTASTAAVVADEPDNPNLVDTYYLTDKASVHAHVLRADDVCDLHLHESNEEATLIATGLAHVTTHFGRDGAPASLDEVYRAGTLVAVPRFCGHRWHNVTPGTSNTNLVFSRPRFTFNEFVAPTDPRLVRAGPPLVVDLHARLSQFVASAEGARLEALDALGGALFAVLVREALSLEADAGEPAVLYVVGGEGELQAGRRNQLGPTDLAVITRARGARIHAQPGKPMAALLFFPER